MLRHALLTVPLPLLCLAVASIVCAAPSVRQVRNSIVMENDTCRYRIGFDGQNMSFGPPDGEDYCEPGQPFMRVCVGDTPRSSNSVTFLGGDLAAVSFADCGIVVKVRLEAKPECLTVTVDDMSTEGVQWLQFGNLSLTITDSVGTLVNAAWNDDYGACLMACNDKTEAYGGSGDHGLLSARCWPDSGFVGARYAIVGVPTGKTEPDAKVLAAIGRMELAEKLPHPMLNGTWIKQSPERFRSYLMVHDLSEANVDQVIEAAKGGFGCIEFYPWASTPSYRINEGLFPGGLEGLKKTCDKIHAAGMQVGLHAMQSMVGWGAKNDPYISPKADARLLQDPRGKLAAAIDDKATTPAIEGGVEEWPERGDLCIDGEIIGYLKRTAAGFEEVTRGLHGTTVSAHPAGAEVGCLVNCFPIWGHTVYCPDLKTDLPDEISARLAEVFNACGADMSYFDGGEELCKQPPLWRSLGTIALGVTSRLQKPIILEGNALYTNLSWHVITRGSPHFDPIYFGRREYTLRFKGTNPAGHKKNLLTGDVGWFAPHLWSASTDAVTPDEVLLLCLKAVGGKSPISFSISASALNNNPRMPEMLEIIRACDELKRRDYFSPQALSALTEPRTECHLEQTPQGEWNLRPLQFGPAQVVNAAETEQAAWQYDNPHGAQQPFVRLRARPRLEAYGHQSNIVLVDFSQGPLFKADATAADLEHTVAAATEQAPDGTAAFSYKVVNKADKPSQWTKATYELPAPQNLTGRRRLGFWLKSNGTGGILNVQLAGTDMRRDHYVPLDFTGWRFIELNSPAEGEFWNYTWPYTWTDLFYTCYAVYSNVRRLELYVNGLPAGATAECLIGRIEAHHETPAPLQSPALAVNGSKLTLPVTLQPDEYAEVDFYGRCRHYDCNGKLLGTVTPEGKLVLAEGQNQVTFSCAGAAETSTRAEVTLAVRGAALPNVRRAGVKGKTAVYPGLQAPE